MSQTNPLAKYNTEQLQAFIKRTFLEATAYAIHALRLICDDQYTSTAERRRAATTILKAAGYIHDHHEKTQNASHSESSTGATKNTDALSKTPYCPAEDIDASTPDALIACIVRALKHPSAPSQGIDTLFHHCAEHLKQFYEDNRCDVLADLTKQCLESFLDPEDIEIILPTEEQKQAESEPQEGTQSLRSLIITDQQGQRHIWHLNLIYQNATWQVACLNRQVDTG